MNNQHPHADRTQQIDRLNDMIESVDTAMLVTALPDGSLRSRPMATQQVDREGNVWFFTARDSEKTHEIADDQHVNLSYADTENHRYVSICGKARIERDRNKIDQLWSDSVAAWFPKGKDDPNLVLIRVRIESAEYWDSPQGAMVQLYTYAKSALTGQAPTDAMKHGTIQL